MHLRYPLPHEYSSCSISHSRSTYGLSQHVLTFVLKYFLSPARSLVLFVCILRSSQSAYNLRVFSNGVLVLPTLLYCQLHHRLHSMAVCYFRFHLNLNSPTRKDFITSSGNFRAHPSNASGTMIWAFKIN